MIPPRYQHAKQEDIPKEVLDLFSKILQSRRGIYIHGGVGTGKTHIAYALKKIWDNAYAQMKVRDGSIFWNVPDLMREVQADFDRSMYDKARPIERINNHRGVVFLDDIGSEKGSEYTKESLFIIINSRYEDMRPIVFTSNLTIKELAEKFDDRIASRIVESCDIVELTGKDRRMEKAKKVRA